MSALVLKICSEYAKALGLNFPPCVQQEINAICEWVDKHTIKDMTISQDGYNVTFTFKTENDTTKEFTFTIPKKVDIDELEKVLVGSESVVVNRSEDNSKLQVRLDKGIIDGINSKITKPETPSEESVVTMFPNGLFDTKPLSEIGGGGKLYAHTIELYSSTNGRVYFIMYFTERKQFDIIPSLFSYDLHKIAVSPNVSTSDGVVYPATFTNGGIGSNQKVRYWNGSEYIVLTLNPASFSDINCTVTEL